MLRKRPSRDDGGDNWMTTYSDLVTLLLTFFIMLFSMAVLDQQKFKNVSQSLQSAFTHNDKKSGEMLFDNEGDVMIDLLNNNQTMVDNKGNPLHSESPDQALGRVKRQITDSITDLDISEYVTVIDEEYRIILRLDTIILFDMGSAEIKTEGFKAITELGDILNTLGNEIIINGHTCDLPINTSLYPTNWELSTKRASNVSRILIEQCNIDPSRITAAGHAEFKPLIANTSEENRKQNRRIEIFIEK